MNQFEYEAALKAMETLLPLVDELRRANITRGYLLRLASPESGLAGATFRGYQINYTPGLPPGVLLSAEPKPLTDSERLEQIKTLVDESYFSRVVTHEQLAKILDAP